MKVDRERNNPVESFEEASVAGTSNGEKRNNGSVMSSQQQVEFLLKLEVNKVHIEFLKYFLHNSYFSGERRRFIRRR